MQSISVAYPNSLRVFGPQTPEARSFAASNVSTILVELLADAQKCLTTDIDASRAALSQATDLLLGRTSLQTAGPATPRMGGLAPWQARRISAYIDTHIDRAISIETLAEIAALSCSYLCRAFKVSFGEPPHVHIMRKRVERAKTLMLETRDPLGQIASACGFSDQAHLCRLFRRSEGSSPNQWRRQHWVEAENVAQLAA